MTIFIGLWKFPNLPNPIKHLTISSLKIIKCHFRQGSKEQGPMKSSIPIDQEL
jgi:hypothetical protein